MWQRNASRGNAFAQEIAAHAGRWLRYPVESNELFLKLGATGKQRLREQGVGFSDWGAVDSGEARLVVSWDQPPDDVSTLCAVLDRL